MKLNQQQGFNLIELLIVVVVISILAAIALPSYQESVRKGNRSDGQAQLLEAASRMERYFYKNNSYHADLTELGYSASSAVASPEGHYTLSVVAATASCPITTCYKLQATAVNNQVADGNITLDSLGQKLPAEKW